MKQTKQASWRHVLAKCAFALLATQPLISTANAQENPMVQPIYSNGGSYGDWSASWWEWVLSIPADRNPNLDANGTYCGEGQTGNVWFLAGAFGGDVKRECTVPLGKSIFFPLINNLAYGPKGNETILDLRKLAASTIDQVKTQDKGGLYCKLKLDGQDEADCASALSNFRAQSPAFQAIVRTQSILPPKTYDPIVSDGYWMLLKPLPAGKHTLSYGGATDGFSVNINYILTVK